MNSDTRFSHTNKNLQPVGSSISTIFSMKHVSTDISTNVFSKIVSTNAYTEPISTNASVYKEVFEDVFANIPTGVIVLQACLQKFFPQHPHKDVSTVAFLQPSLPVSLRSEFYLISTETEASLRLCLYNYFYLRL